PRQHQLPEHLIAPGGLAEAEQVIRTAQRIVQVPHPRRGDLQRPAGRGSHGQAQVQLTLPGRQPLPCRGPERLQLPVVMRRAQVLNAPRATPRGPDDLHRDRSRGRLHRANVRHPTRLRARLVRKSAGLHLQICRPQRCTRANPDPVIKVRSQAGVAPTPVGSPSTPAGAPLTPAGAPLTPAGAPLTPAGAPLTPAAAPSIPADTPPAPADAPPAPAGRRLASSHPARQLGLFTCYLAPGIAVTWPRVTYLAGAL